MHEAFASATEAICDWSWWPHACAALDRHMQQDGGHDWSHLYRVLVNAHTIMESEDDVSWPALAAAVLFHDAVNLPKDHPHRSQASQRSAMLAKAYFSSVRALSVGELDLLVDAIASHSFSSGREPCSLEGMILRDADRLESLGALGIARTFFVSGLMKRQIASMDDPFGRERELDDLEFALDHFQTKLLHLLEGFCTEKGRQMAQQRHDFLVTFLEQVGREIGQPYSV